MGFSLQACVDIWNNPTPDVEVRYDLQQMEQMVAAYEIAERKWWDEFERTQDHTAPQPEAWWFHYDRQGVENE